MKPTKEHYQAFMDAKEHCGSGQTCAQSILETADGFIDAGFDPRAVGKAEAKVKAASKLLRQAEKMLVSAHGDMAKARESAAALNDGTDPVPEIPIT